MGKNLSPALLMIKKRRQISRLLFLLRRLLRLRILLLFLHFSLCHLLTPLYSYY
ncbi:hypothetical protein ES705_31450 [subsurface metagenome]